MRAVALLVCSGLVRVGAFASLPDSEQIESRNAGSTHVKVRSNAYCGNRVCAGKSCAQSRVTEDAAACAAAVMKDPKCGNSFSFGENSDPNQRYCDCAPVGAPCVATPFAFYDVYELIFDKTEKPAVCSQPSPPPPHPPPSPPPPHSPPSPTPPPPRPPPSPPPPRSPKVVESEVMGDAPDASACEIGTLMQSACGPSGLGLAFDPYLALARLDGTECIPVGQPLANPFG